MTKRLVTIQDLSCIGRCSLGVAMSVIPAMGIETAALPTAILSTHTAFDGFTFLDMTDEAEKILQHWLELGMHFDTIYIGYLGSARLIEMASRFISLFRSEDTQVIVDPAFGDNGTLYKGFDTEYVRGIRELCRMADIILPNVTEICYLTDTEYQDSEEFTARLPEIADKLTGGTLKNVLITSGRFSGNRTGLVCAGKDAFSYPHERKALSCHGSGDVFASVFAGLMTLGRSIRESAVIAADFTRDSLQYSMQCEDHRWYGVDYEKMMPELIRRIG